ncbi:hypothetical protein [Flavobacterium reichenbachii]|uniref:Gliding motility protein n=1 Tax=Flavobacterium reichenbachii TaxID=362418 RepID=A0A085ZDE8_9FLAO|nr:hypothetical protein [Flavobacterium reichenbachii]KFF02462.1 hypothetical protein IW19_24550 [Flavobacterium reichenbachii]OXB13558.1 hypothetical protein B0A68_14500 [Flavobacterium reichenbachii]
MSFSSLKNITPASFYFASVISLVFANVLKDTSLSFYYILLILGLAFFFVGMLKRSRTKK